MRLILQDKKQIINFDNAQQIHVREEEITFIWSNEDVLVLHFGDEELAEKIFNRIISAIEGKREVLHI